MQFFFARGEAFVLPLDEIFSVFSTSFTESDMPLLISSSFTASSFLSIFSSTNGSFSSSLLDESLLASFNISEISSSFSPIIDNLQRALTSFVDDEGLDTKSFVDGTNAILRDFESLLDKTGVKTINPEGEKFDPNFHEAMFEIPSDDHEAGVILQVIEQGYVLENRLLRAAKVGVSTKKDEEKPN